MRTDLVAFAVSFLAGLALTRLFRDLAIRFGLYDKSDGGRKLHTRPIPRVGGVAVATAFAVPLVGLALWHGDVTATLYGDRPFLAAMCVGGSLMLALGLWDDIIGAPPWMKFGLQILAGLAVCAAGVRIEGVAVPSFGIVELGWASVPLTVFWIVLVTNAINLIDGLDGLAGSVVALASSTLLVMSVVDGHALPELVLAALVGATLAFLVFNINPASIFLGDTGSLFLGFLLALVSVHSSQKAYTLFSVAGSVLVLAVPLFDLSMAVVRRALTGRPLFSADQYHVHHLLLRRGLSQRQSVAMLVAGAAVFEIAALGLIYANDAVSALIILLLVPVFAAVIHLLGYTQIIRTARRELVFRKLTEEAEDREGLVNALRRDLTALRDPDLLWQRLETCAAGLGLETLELDVEPQMLGFTCTRHRVWQRSTTPEERGIHLQDLARHEFVLQIGGRRLGSLALSWYREFGLFPPHDRALHQILADSTSEALVLAMIEDHRMENVLPFPRVDDERTNAS